MKPQLHLLNRIDCYYMLYIVFKLRSTNVFYSFFAGGKQHQNIGVVGVLNNILFVKFKKKSKYIDLTRDMKRKLS